MLAFPTADAVPVVGDTFDAHGIRTPCLGMGGKSVDLGPVPVREGAPRPPSSNWRMGTMAEIVLFHSALGLRPGVTAAADRLRAAGHKVHTPDYYEGEVFDDLDEGLRKCDALGYQEIARRRGRPADQRCLGPDVHQISRPSLRQSFAVESAAKVATDPSQTACPTLRPALRRSHSQARRRQCRADRPTWSARRVGNHRMRCRS
jgi:hypothetical protein